MKKLTAILVLFAFIPTQLSAWSAKGHAVVAGVAFSRLTGTTKKNIRVLLDQESLTSVASWADEIRKDRDETFDWHFVDIPKNAARFDQSRDCFRPQDNHLNAQTDHHNCVVDRIEMFRQVLADENASRKDRVEALKFLVHFVGDVHQPLHDVDEARGGNDIKVAVFGSDQCGNYPCNLHGAWDYSLIEHTGYSQDQYVRHLKNVVHANQLQQKSGGSPEDWANESLLAARKVLDQKTTSIDQAYYDANIGMVDERLALAGVRLAALLNDSLGKIPTHQLKKSLEKDKTSAAPPAESLPTGMSITPSAARGSTFQPLSPDLPDLPQFTVDHPLTTALSPDGNTLLILTSGFNRNLDAKGKAIPAQSNEYVFVFDVRGAAPVKQQVLKIANTYAGLVWAPDGKTFYVSGGSNDNVHMFALLEGRWAEAGEPIRLGHSAGLGAPSVRDGVSTPNRPVVAGLAINSSGTRLLAANYENDSVTLVDLSTRQKIAELDLRPGMNDPAQKGVAGGEYPYWVAFQGDDKAYVSCLRDREIVVLDLHAAPAIARRIKVRGQPGKMLLNRAQTLLFAVADNSDSVVMVDTSADRVLAEIKTTAPAAVFPNRGGFKGSIPTGLALSPDEKTLYVTNAGTNSVAVIALDHDLDDSRVTGLIPTGWYPNSVSVSHDGAALYVVNGKGNAGPNPKGCRNTFSTAPGDRPCAATQQYILQMGKGGFSVIPRPGAAELQTLTAQVARNNHFLPAQNKDKDKSTQNQDEIFSFLRQKIKHVIYIVKENRTYDQVLGDLEKGNGDPALNLFPETMTPNHHELARRFVTLDNFYDSGEVSGDGWNWSTAARTTDLTQRTIPINYAVRGMTYDVEGSNRGINVGAINPQDRTAAKLENFEDQLPGTADVAAPDGPEDETGAGYLWDAVLRAHLTVRNYGFYVDLAPYTASPETGPALPLLHDPASTGTRVAVPTKTHLQDVTDPYFRSFDMHFPDYWRFKEWEREFEEFVKGDNLPSLELLRLPRDHFGDFKDSIDGTNTVETQMADNDYALGLVVERVARSKYASSTLIFVIEDDAQNGPDHVDAHRSLAYVIGPYVKQGAVVSARYTTVSVLRTIEEILGTGPLGLYDALQPPMTEVFSAKQSAWNYSARVPAILRTTQLPLPAASAEEKPAAPRRDAAYWTENSQGFDFSGEDKLDSARFNLMLWNGLKGEDQPYPSQRDGRDLSKNRRRLLQQFYASQTGR